MAVGGAALLWLGALLGANLASVVAFVGLVLSLLLAVRWRAFLLVTVVATGAISGAVAATRVAATLEAAIPQGRGVIVGRAVTDSLPYGTQHRLVVVPESWSPRSEATLVWDGPRLVVVGDIDGIAVGDRLTVVGSLRTRPHLVRGDPVAGTMVADSIEVWSGPPPSFLAAGNLFRSRVTSRLSRLGETPAAALLAGFLIGDTAALPLSDHESLRRSGLTHFVAVSGSNVALVLAAWWLVLGPFGGSTRVRAVTGMLVLVVFVAATRWEASVIRAATMAALVLAGRVVGVPIDAWTALGGAVSVLLAISGDLAYDVGFQLSVAATAGVLLGMRLGGQRRPAFIWNALAATASAQAAVFPLLLLHFGAVPLLAPVANLLAAPLVTAATAMAGLGVVVPWELPLEMAEQGGAAVLAIARVGGRWPQLGPGVAIATAGVIIASWQTRFRLLVIGAVVVAGLSAGIPPGPPDVPTVTFLDVGQGDAVLMQEPSGAAMLVDGGRDPQVLGSALRRYGIERIDLVVATHGDADHVGGFEALEQQVDIGHFWGPAQQLQSELLRDVLAAMEEAEVETSMVEAGDSARLGAFEIEVLGPMRRYAAENDGSVVLWVEVAGRSILLPGDIGAVAQRELPPLRPDVLLLPHHGAATTDVAWLEATAGPVSVISVGENTYGHPDPAILAVLEDRGIVVLQTIESGDISLPFP